eukprot:7390792-Prymnesium_polylepis.1
MRIARYSNTLFSRRPANAHMVCGGRARVAPPQPGPVIHPNPSARDLPLTSHRDRIRASPGETK